MSSAPLRILTIIETLGRGGAEQALAVLAPELKRRGVEVEIAALFPPYTVAEDLRRVGIPVHALDVSHRWNLAQTAVRLRKLSGWRPYDVVHGHLFFGYLAARMLKQVGGAKAAIATLHGLAYSAYPADTPLKRARQRFDARVLGGGFDLVTAVSQAVASHYREHLGISGVEIIGNAIGIEAPGEAPATARRWLLETFALPQDAFVVVVPARLVREKGHTHLLDAVASMERGPTPLRVLLLGGGPLRAPLEAQAARLGLVEDGRVHFAGEVSADDARRAMRGADLVALSSVSEGLPVSICEAASMGRPILATRAGGIPEAVHDERGACLVEPGSPSALAQALQRLMQDAPYRAELARYAQAASVRYTPEAVATGWLALYERARAGRAAQPGAPAELQ